MEHSSKTKQNKITLQKISESIWIVKLNLEKFITGHKALQKTMHKTKAISICGAGKNFHKLHAKQTQQLSQQGNMHIFFLFLGAHNEQNMQFYIHDITIRNIPEEYLENKTAKAKD